MGRSRKTGRIQRVLEKDSGHFSNLDWNRLFDYSDPDHTLLIMDQPGGSQRDVVYMYVG
jgi:hypothetical protein